MTTESGNERPRVLVLARGEQNSGGSGFRTLVQNSRTNPAILNADIVGVVSTIPDGNVYKLAKYLDVPFECLQGSYEASDYQALRDLFRADHVTCSGWLRKVKGLDPRRTTNVHPGYLKKFGGKGYYGHHVHEAVLAAYLRGEVTQSAVSMHFVTEEFDDPRAKFFEYPVALPAPIDTSLTADKIGSMVNEVERAWQSYKLNQVVNGGIFLKVWEENGETQYEVGVRDNYPAQLFL